MEYKLITEDRYDEVVSFVHQYFLKDEPLCKAVQLCKPGERHLGYENHLNKTLKDNLSIMAVGENGEIAGVALSSEARRSDFDKDVEIKDENLRKIYCLIKTVNIRGKIFDRFNVDKVFDFRILCVSDRFRGKGIAKELVSRSEKLARERGYSLIKTEASGSFSQKSFISNGFQVLDEQYYDKWCDEFGNKIFEIEPPHVKLQLLYKELK